MGVRELLGLGPAWLFEVPPKAEAAMAKYVKSWEQLFDPQGFAARWGPTTAEQRHRCFNYTHSTHECNWAAPSWPYETARVLTGLSNLLNEYPAQSTMGKAHYMQLLRQYAQAHTKSYAANASSPYIGENIEPHDGYWVARQIMYGEQPISHGGVVQPPQNATADKDRSVDYNHSTFADLIIEGLVGLRAFFGSFFTVNPLSTGLQYFALDNVHYHNHSVTIAWDADGSRAYKGCAKGLCVWVDGEMAATSPTLTALNVSLPATRSAEVALKTSATFMVPTVEIAPGVHFPQMQLGVCPTNASVSLPYYLKMEPSLAAIDTAFGYTDQPAIAAILRNEGRNRSTYWLTSKIPGGLVKSGGPCTAKDPQAAALAFVQEDLKQLNVSQIDLMLLHEPCAPPFQAQLVRAATRPLCLFYDTTLNDIGSCRIGDMSSPRRSRKPLAVDLLIWRGLKQALDMGLVRAIGVDRMTVQQLAPLLVVHKPAVHMASMSIAPTTQASHDFASNSQSFSLVATSQPGT